MADKNITTVSEIASIENYDKVFINDSGSLKQITVANLMKSAPSGIIEESDPTVSEWAKQPTKPKYTAEEVGALPDSVEIPKKMSDLENDNGFITNEEVPSKLPNPQKIIFTGAVSIEYDGSSQQTVHIPNGGSGSEAGFSPTITENSNNDNNIYKLDITTKDSTFTTPNLIGEKGDPGETPNIQIGTVQTLEPGQQATASMTGTPENPILNIGIPKGEKGQNGTGGSIPDDYEAVKENSEKISIDKIDSFSIASNKADIFEAVKNSKAEYLTITDGSNYWDAEEITKYPDLLNMNQLRNNRFYANMWLPNNLEMEQDYRYNVDKNGQIRLYDIIAQKTDLIGLSPWGICLRAEGQSFPTAPIHFILSTFKIIGLHSITGKWELIRKAKPIASLFDIAHTSTEGHVIDVARTDLGNDMFSFAINDPSNWQIDGDDMCFHFFLESGYQILKADIESYSKLIITFQMKVQEAEFANVFTCSAGCDAIGSSSDVEAFFSRFNAVTNRLLEYNVNNCLENESELISDQLSYIDALIINSILNNSSTGTGENPSPGGTNEYTELEKIEINKDCYFDSQIIPNQNINTDIKVRVKNAEIMGTYVFGVRDNVNKYTVNLTDNWYCTRGPVSSAAGSTAFWDDSNGWTIEQKGKIFKFNGTEIQLSDIDSLDFSTSVFIGNVNNNGSPYVGQGFDGEFYYCKMYDGDNIIADIIPVKKSDGTLCLYDKSNNRFLYNLGTDNLST